MKEEEFYIEFNEPWFEEEYQEEYQLKILEDLGESIEMFPNDEGIEELTIVHKYRVEKL